MIEKYLNKTELKIKWKVKFVEELLLLNNEDLLDKTLEKQMPDDYDSCFSTDGEWEAEITILILKERMKSTGWI